jgi:hypothetical protein
MLKVYVLAYEGALWTYKQPYMFYARAWAENERIVSRATQAGIPHIHHV